MLQSQPARLVACLLGVALSACSTGQAPPDVSPIDVALEHARTGCESATTELSEDAVDELARAARADPQWNSLYRAYSEAVSGNLDLSGIPADPPGTAAVGGSPWTVRDIDTRASQRLQQLAQIVTDECRKALID